MLAVAAASLRRVAGPAGVGLALLAGLLGGLCLRGLPAPELVPEAHALFVLVFGALLGIPLAASLPTAERAAGTESLTAVRPIGSPAWVGGRLLGGALGIATLALVIATASRVLGGDVLVPQVVYGERFDAGLPTPSYRFPLPAGRAGPFELLVAALPAGPEGGTLAVDVARGARAAALPAVRVAARRARLSLPDLAPERGDLHVTLRPSSGLRLAREAPRLVIGEQPLGAASLPLPLDRLATLGLACFAALAVGCAFHFPTACLAGLLVLAGRPPQTAPGWGLALAGLAALALAGTAITRRTTLP